MPLNSEPDAVVRRRIIYSAGANLIAQGLYSVTQIVSVALMANYWNTGIYADWIKLSTIPGLFSLAVTGFGSVAANELTIEMDKGDTNSQQVLYQTTFYLIILATIALTVLVILLPTRFIANTIGLNTFSTENTRLILLCFVLQFGLQQLQSFTTGCFRSLKLIFTGVMWLNATRLSYFFCVISILPLGKGPLELAVISTGLQTLIIGSMVLHLASKSPAYRLAGLTLCKKTLYRTALPSIMFNAIPLGNAIRQQGIILTIAHLLPNEFVVSFNAMRTLGNSASQLVALTNQSIRPEISIAFGANRIDRIRDIHRKSCRIALLAGFAIATLLSVSGSILFHTWTSNKVPFDSLTFQLILISVVLNGLWLTSCSVSLATNRHMKLGAFYVSTALISLTLGYLLVAKIGITGAAAFLLVVDLVMLAFVIPQSIYYTNDSLHDFLRSFIPNNASKTTP